MGQKQPENAYRGDLRGRQICGWIAGAMICAMIGVLAGVLVVVSDDAEGHVWQAVVDV